MRSWPHPDLPITVGESGPLRLFDQARQRVAPVEISGGEARLYVCGVTPYDTTHLGHAATYVAFDLVDRALRDGGHTVRYVQNVTDIDDPLLERAARDGIDWRDLAEDQLDLYRRDMAALSVIPPDHLVAVTEEMAGIVRAITALSAAGATYTLEDDGVTDTYLDLALAPGLGELGHLDRDTMLTYSAERGGDPDRPGKRDALDPLLWRGHREGEPSWDGAQLGAGRPGWHIECTAIALDHLGETIDVQGGGSDLIFPHHEMSVVQAEAITGTRPFAAHTTHQGMVAYDGEKMSKSKGNLVRVSQLIADGVDPAAIRLALLAHHYRTDWEWTDRDLTQGQERLARWRETLLVDVIPGDEGRSTTAAVDEGTDATLREVREAIADDLDAPRALAAVDAWCTDGPASPAGAAALAALVTALLGVALV